MERLGYLPVLLCFILLSGTVQAKHTFESQDLDKAFHLLVTGEKSKALQIIEPLAQHGSVRAQVMYGDYFITEENNLAEGRIWLLAAARTNDAYAQYRLAMSYLWRASVKENEEGRKWLIKAAEQGLYEAEEQLTLGYTNGLWGFPRDVDQEDYWRERANKHRAEQGHAK